MSFTGKILAGDDFLREYYNHAWFQFPWAYKKLTELIFKNGHLIETIDQSQIASDIRNKIDNDNELSRIKVIGLFLFSAVNKSIIPDYKDKFWWLGTKHHDVSSN